MVVVKVLLLIVIVACEVCWAAPHGGGGNGNGWMKFVSKRKYEMFQFFVLKALEFSYK
jgi:hypothetical protein